jgi:hypothetical protein
MFALHKGVILMKTIRRFGFILFILFLGIVIGHASFLVTFLIVSPLLIIWLLAWDEKKYQMKQYRRSNRIYPSENFRYK